MLDLLSSYLQCVKFLQWNYFFVSFVKELWETSPLSVSFFSLLIISICTGSEINYENNSMNLNDMYIFCVIISLKLWAKIYLVISICNLQFLPRQLLIKYWKKFPWNLQDMKYYNIALIAVNVLTTQTLRSSISM